MPGPEDKRYVANVRDRAAAVWRLLATRSAARQAAVLAYANTQVEASRNDLREYQTVLLSLGISNSRQAAEHGVRWEPKKSSVFDSRMLIVYKFD